MSDHKPKTSPTSPLPLRTLGRRGGVLALALWGSSAFNAAAQDPPVIDPNAPIDTAESPPVDIYGGPPMRDEPSPIKRKPPARITKPDDAPWEYPSDLQGDWDSAGLATFSVHGSAYTFQQGRARDEAGTLSIYPVIDLSAAPNAPRLLLVLLTDRLLNGVPAPDQEVIWFLSPDLSKLTDNTGQVFARRADHPLPVSDYGLSPIPE